MRADKSDTAEVRTVTFSAHDEYYYVAAITGATPYLKSRFYGVTGQHLYCYTTIQEFAADTGRSIKRAQYLGTWWLTVDWAL